MNTHDRAATVLALPVLDLPQTDQAPQATDDADAPVKVPAGEVLLAPHVMVDLETMGAGPDAAIVAIGAVAFDPAAGVVLAEHYQKVDLASAVACGGVMDAATVLWWLRQPGAARDELQRDGLHIAVALEHFGRWMRDVAVPEVQVWGNGAAFDNVILRGAYQRLLRDAPWQWWRDRCYRTTKDLAPHVKMQRGGVHHHALDDARSQAVHLMQMMAALAGAQGAAA